MSGKWCALFFLLEFVTHGLCYLEYDSWIRIDLHHSLDSSNEESFRFRGNITIPSLNSGLSNLLQETFKSRDVQELEHSAGQNGIYRLRATVVYPNGAKQTYLTSIKACGLLQSKLNDLLWISIDKDGFVIGITETLALTTMLTECKKEDLYIPKLIEFDTDVLIKYVDLAPAPDTGSFIQKMEREREARERGEVRDSRGFFAKYWMYIVPIILLVFISGATNQDTQK